MRRRRCRCRPKAQFFVLSVVNGSISLSFGILPIFGMLWEVYGIAYQTMFQAYLVVVILSGVRSFFLLPDEPYDDVSEDNDGLDDLLLSSQVSTSQGSLVNLPTIQVYEPTPEALVMESAKHFNHLIEQPLNSFLRRDPYHELERHESFVLSKKAIEKGQLGLVSLKDLPFYQQVTSGAYVRTLIVFVVTCFFANFYIASITTEVRTVCWGLLLYCLGYLLLLTILFILSLTACRLCGRVFRRRTTRHDANLFSRTVVWYLGFLYCWLAHGSRRIGNLYTRDTLVWNIAHGDFVVAWQFARNDSWICHLHTLSAVSLSSLYCQSLGQAGIQVLWHVEWHWLCH